MLNNDLTITMKTKPIKPNKTNKPTEVQTMKLWQRIAALAVLAIFVLSILPAALAKSEGKSGSSGPGSLGVGVGARMEAEMEEEMAEGMEGEASGGMMGEQSGSSDSAGPGMPASLPGGVEGVESADETTDEKMKELQEKMQEKMAKEMEKAGEKQEKLTEKMAKIQEKFAEHRERFLQEKQKYEEMRKEFLEGKGDLAKLREAAKCRADTEECKAKKIGLKQGMTQHLANTIDLIGSSLLKLQAKVEASNVLSEEEKQSALNRINALEQSLTAKKEEVLALGDDVSGAELKRQIKDLKKLWQEVRKEQRRILSSLISQRQDNIVNVYGNFVEKMEERIADLVEKEGVAGVAVAAEQVNELRSLLEAYKAKVAAVEAAQEQARLAWERAREEGSPEAMRAAREKQDLFKVATKEAKAALRELLVKYREVKAPVDVAEQERQPGVEAGVPVAIQPVESEPAESTGPAAPAEAGVPTAMGSGASAEAEVSAEASASVS